MFIFKIALLNRLFQHPLKTFMSIRTINYASPATEANAHSISLYSGRTSKRLIYSLN